MDEGVAQAKLAGTAPAETIPEHYVEAQTSLVGRALRTLKHGEAFAVMDAHGDMGLVPESPEGLFFQDTRHLSFFELRLESRRPLLLASVLQDDNAALSVDLTNPDIAIDAEFGSTPRPNRGAPNQVSVVRCLLRAHRLSELR